MRQDRHRRRRVLSLFSGAGGLDLGLETAGFEVALCVERDRWSCETLCARRRKLPEWGPTDVHQVSPEKLLKQAGIRKRELTLLAGGPPCQPFSKAGQWARGSTARLADPRAATLKAFFDVAEAALPEVLLLENVAGMVSGRTRDLDLFLARAFRRLNRARGAHYDPQVLRVNAAEYGVPQLRERVILVAHRSGIRLELPEPTHLAPDEASVRGKDPFRTAWDAIGDLDLPAFEADLLPRGRYGRLLPSVPEGSNYLWHTPRGGGEPLFGWRTRYWTFLLKLSKSKPSWTIAAQPGPGCGPFHWRSRMLSTRGALQAPNLPG